MVRHIGSDLPASDVTVYLRNISKIAARTGSDGRFGFFGVPALMWSAEPEYSAPAIDVLTASDAVHTLELAASQEPIDATTQLAADVSGNGRVTSFDAVLILQRIVGSLDTLPAEQACGSSWFFLPAPTSTLANQDLLMPHVDGETCEPGAMIFDPLFGLVSGQDFLIGAFGDVDASSGPGSAGEVLARSAQPERSGVHIGSPLRRGRYVRIPVFIEPGFTIRAIDISVPLPEGMTPRSVRKESSAGTTLVAFNRNLPGEIRISLASATPIEPGLLLTIGLVLDDHARMPELRASRLRVD